MPFPAEALIVPLVLAGVFFILRTTRATIIYSLERVDFSRAEIVEAGLLDFSKTYGNISIAKLCILNKTFRHIDNVILNLPVYGKYVVNVDSTSTISKKSIKTNSHRDYMSIEINELPRNEKIDMFIMSDGHLGYVIEGGSNKYIIKKNSGSDYLLLLSAIIVMVWIAAAYYSWKTSIDTSNLLINKTMNNQVDLSNSQ